MSSTLRLMLVFSALSLALAGCDDGGGDDAGAPATDSGPGCSTCAEVQAGADATTICPGAAATAFTDLGACICGMCGTECADTACAMPQVFPSMECQTCFGAACGAEVMACASN